MTNKKEMKVQINEYRKLLEDLKSKEIIFPKKFATGVLIEKLPDSWNDYKNGLSTYKRLSLLKNLLLTYLLKTLL